MNLLAINTKIKINNPKDNNAIYLFITLFTTYLFPVNLLLRDSNDDYFKPRSLNTFPFFSIAFSYLSFFFIYICNQFVTM